MLLCIAPAWELGDLACPDVGAFNFPVSALGSHSFDGNFDGVGCENY